MLLILLSLFQINLLWLWISCSWISRPVSSLAFLPWIPAQVSHPGLVTLAPLIPTLASYLTPSYELLLPTCSHFTSWTVINIFETLSCGFCPSALRSICCAASINNIVILFTISFCTHLLLKRINFAHLEVQMNRYLIKTWISFVLKHWWELKQFVHLWWADW